MVKPELGREPVSLQIKAKLTWARLCINSFGRYGQGGEEIFRHIRQLFEAEKGAQSPDVRSWMSRREDSRKKEIAEGRYLRSIYSLLTERDCVVEGSHLETELSTQNRPESRSNKRKMNSSSSVNIV